MQSAYLKSKQILNIMKYPLFKSMLVAGIALAPVAGMAQSKGGAVPESPNAPLLKNDGEGKDGDRKPGDRPARLSPEERAKQLATMFDRLDADANGNLSREEFAKMGARQPRKKGDRKGKEGGPAAKQAEEEKAMKKAAEEKKEAEEKAMKKAADEKKESTEKAAQEAEAKTPEKTRTTGSTGGTGSSASGSQADGSAATGTTAPKP